MLQWKDRDCECLTDTEMNKAFLRQKKENILTFAGQLNIKPKIS